VCVCVCVKYFEYKFLSDFVEFKFLMNNIIRNIIIFLRFCIE